MTIEAIFTFNLALLAAMMSPGPALLVAIRSTLTGGRAAGFAIGCGLGLMAAVWTLIALLGLEAVFQLFPWAYALVKGAGALYLIYIAWKTWRGARDEVSQRHGFGLMPFEMVCLSILPIRNRLFSRPPC
ncbi:MAG: LysE family translocator [Fimbriimonadaceae bacterium]|nr:LysE family translocator [Alphaproteobacteria bacterium]